MVISERWSSGPSAVDQVGNLVFCGLKAVGRDIGSLHTGRGLQNDDAIAADGAAEKNSGPRQYQHDDDGGQQLQDQQRCDAQALPGAAGLQVL